MCFFNFKNKVSPKAFFKGIEEFDCGHCPECLQKKSRRWALRCAMEARVSPGVMVTLTYDTYKVINGKESAYEENPINPNMELSKSDCQKFLKRLRKHFEPQKIKYLLTAERGKRGRAHYHALLFGVQFNDLIKYKKSDRGNWIYKSQTLTKLWSKGICTVDCINLSAKTARYCTKYCAKDSGANETFMLFSRGIGDSELMRLFNGKSYWVDGREYSIPKQIWQKVIEKRYNCKGYSKYIGREHVEIVEKTLCNQLDRIEKKYGEKTQQQRFIELIKRQYKYVDKPTAFKRKMLWKKTFEFHKLISTPVECMRARCFHCSRRALENSENRYNEQKFKREIFEQYRDNDKQYQAYLEYWKEKNRVAKFTQPSVEERILALPDNKYRSYKAQAIRAKIVQYAPDIIYKEKIEKYVVPSHDVDTGKKNGHFHIFENRVFESYIVWKAFIPPRSNCQGFLPQHLKTTKKYMERSFAPLARHYRANDTENFSAEDKFFWTVQKILRIQAENEKIRKIKQGLYIF